MPTLIIKGKITKGYEHWLSEYDGLAEHRETNYGIKTVFRGQDLNESDTIHVVMFTPSMEALQGHMEADAEIIARAGGDPNPESATISMCSD